MTAETVTIAPFDPRGANEREYAALNDFQNHMLAERQPDDPPVPLEERVRGWRNIPPIVNYAIWAAWSPGGDAVVAAGGASVLRTDENRHLLNFDIGVLPEYRRRGLGRRLLALAAEMARREDRRLMMAGTNDRVPAGEAFMRRLEAKKGLESHTNQLDLAGLDRDLLRRWLARAEGGEAAARFALGLWSGPYPEEDLAAIAALHEILNQEPRDDLEIEDFRFTPEQIRQQERATFARGAERWTLYARARSKAGSESGRQAGSGRAGAFAGFTEVFWHPNRPMLLDQGATGVFPQYRNHGLGRWLKAAMLDKVIRERPQVRFVRAGNADSNAPMLKINRALGFAPYIARCTWQVVTDRVVAYLHGTNDRESL
jgi:GNAT superfamily N-acetyltransferase